MRRAANRSRATTLLLGLVALLVLSRRGHSSPTPIQVNIQTTPAERRSVHGASTDYAALMAASVAAVFAVVVGPGRWDLFSMLLGLTLLSVLFGYFDWEKERNYYRVDPTSRLSRLKPRRDYLQVLAFAALVGLCSGLATAWLAQLSLEKFHWVVDCPETKYVQVITPEGVERQEVLGTRSESEECISGKVTAIVIPTVWIIVALGVYGWLLDLYSRRRRTPPDSELLHVTHGPATVESSESKKETVLGRPPST
jgi:hypothetical protein